MNETQSRIKIAIADDHALFRKGIIKLLDVERYAFMFDVANGQELILRLQEDRNNLPHIVIMDVEMPIMNGYAATSWMRENCPEVRVLVVSMIDKEEAIVRMLRLDVKGYLSKEMEPEDLHEALQSIMRKGYYYTDIVTNKLLHSIKAEVPLPGANIKKFEVRPLWEQLNQRQKDFIRYACTEMRYEDIASIMYVSPKTVDGYRDAVFEKFNIKSRVGLVLFAIKNGLVTV
jgi:two-component system, NarL family, invasion response regulator UvrY